MSNKKNTLQIAISNIKNIDDSIFKVLVISSILVTSLGIVFSFTVFLATGLKDGAFKIKLCFTSTCVQNFKTIFTSVLDILSTTGVILGGLITLGAIIVALLSYLSNNRALALANHLSHISIFSDYIHREIEKKSRLNKSSFDILKWYNLLYQDQELGELTVSKSYETFISDINSQIRNSNNLITKDADGKYLYKVHQRLIKSVLAQAGINLSALPRLDFHEVEGEVIQLIETINKSFCKSPTNLTIEKRIYI